MGRSKEKLGSGQVALGAWVMIGHPSVVEICAGEGFDWICVDMEHATLVEACKRHNVPAGFHVVPTDGELIKTRIEEGFRFIACGLDTGFIVHGCRTMLQGVGNPA